MTDEISPGLQKAIDETNATIKAAFAARPSMRVRHIKRGTTYEVIGQGWLQTDKPLSDMTPVIVYQGADGHIWVRPESEFTPDRFNLIDGEENRDAVIGEKREGK